MGPTARRAHLPTASVNIDYTEFSPLRIFTFHSRCQREASKTDHFEEKEAGVVRSGCVQAKAKVKVGTEREDSRRKRGGTQVVYRGTASERRSGAVSLERLSGLGRATTQV